MAAIVTTSAQSFFRDGVTTKNGGLIQLAPKGAEAHMVRHLRMVCSQIPVVDRDARCPLVLAAATGSVRQLAQALEEMTQPGTRRCVAVYKSQGPQSVRPRLLVREVYVWWMDGKGILGRSMATDFYIGRGCCANSHRSRPAPRRWGWNVCV
jgi:hypothetical protein